MIRFLLKRLGYLLLTLLITSVVIFTITQIIPGDIARVILGREAGAAAVAALRQRLGLDQPILAQYGRWLLDFATLHWGNSFSLHAPILPIVVDRLHNSIMLAGLALLISVPFGVGLGVAAGLEAGRPLDTIVSAGTLSVAGLPEFVTGVVLIHLVAFDLRLFPASSTLPPGATFLQALPMLVLPAITASLVLLAYFARLTRAGVIEEIKRPYVRTATLKGLPRSGVIVKHVLRNALLPTITVIAINFGWMIGGLIVVENVFNYPGLGSLLAFAIERRDVPLIQAISMVIVVAYALANLVADILYGLLNPRIRVGAKK